MNYKIYNLGMIDTKYFGPEENSALERIIEMNSVEPKNNFWEYYERKIERGKSNI